MVDAGKKEILFTAKCFVETALADAHGIDQVGQRRRFEALDQEYLSGLIKCFSSVEFAGPSNNQSFLRVSIGNIGLWTVSSHQLSVRSRLHFIHDLNPNATIKKR